MTFHCAPVLRAVCTSAWSCPDVKRAREPDVRLRNGAELTALLGACDRATPACVCDAALLGIAYGAGLRRDERALLTLTSINPQGARSGSSARATRSA